MLGIPRSFHCLGLVVLVGTLVLPLAAQNAIPVRVPPMILTLCWCGTPLYCLD